MQNVALAEDHVSVDVAVPAPGVTDIGFAENKSVGGELEATKLTVVVAVTFPPKPEQFKTYVVVAIGCTTSDPESDFDPLHPFDAVQDVVFVDVHVNVEVAVPAPGVTDVGFAEKSRVGASAGTKLTVVLAAPVPPGPEQFSA